MNQKLLTLVATPLLTIMSLSACGSAPEVPPLQGARMGGPFTLLNEDGGRTDESSFKGQYRLVYFGYTFCPDVCPVDVQRLMKGLSALEASDKARAAKIAPIFISVDPARDTPKILKEFTAAFHPRLLGLTGTESEIDAVTKAYGVYFERDKPNAEGGYLVNHSNNAVLYGPTGEPIAIIAHDGSPETIAAELARWVK